jgi:hypothetical protein
VMNGMILGIGKQPYEKMLNRYLMFI